MNFNQIEFETSFGRPDQLFKSDCPEVAFVGRSNVGKSSMINRVFSRKNLERVSSSPGKTATINFFKVDKFHLVDLPGYGYAKVSHSEKRRWAELMEGYFNQERNFSLVVQIVDMRHSPTVDDMNMIEYLSVNGFPFIIVFTKKDKLKKTQQIKRLEELKAELANYPDVPMFPFSAVNGDGAEEIRATIEQYVNDTLAEMDSEE